MAEATAVAKVQEAQAPAIVESESAALISMIERAARDPNCDIDKMERLFKMQQDAVSRRAKTAYLAAFSALQSELPAAVRHGTGHNSKKYARYEDIIETLRPFFSKHGFSISHRVSTTATAITVTGVMGHAAGHSEETSIVLPPDASGNKTAVHAMGSAISYGKRYVTLTLTGIATEDEDDDAKRASAGALISDEQAMELRDNIEASGSDLKKFLAYFKIACIADMRATDFDRAMKALAGKQSK